MRIHLPGHVARLRASETTDTAGRPVAASAIVIRLVTIVSHPNEPIDVCMAVETVELVAAQVIASPSSVTSLMPKVIGKGNAHALMQSIAKNGVPLAQDDGRLAESRSTEKMQYRENQKH